MEDPPFSVALATNMLPFYQWKVNESSVESREKTVFLQNAEEWGKVRKKWKNVCFFTNGVVYYMRDK
jgi:hypothetical protein